MVVELHAAVRDLVQEHGEVVLADPSGFRGLLDDVLDEETASAGDINLLVDAVRFDALAGLRSLVGGGAAPGRAVDEAGARLARDRGGEDRRSASWAVAVLGYATDLVPEAEIRRFRPGTTPADAPTNPSRATSRWPGSQPSPGYLPPPSPSASGQRPASVPSSWPAASAPPAPPAPPATPSGPGVLGHPAPFPPAPRKRGPGLWIALAAVLVLLVGGGVIAVVAVTTGGDEDGGDQEAAVDVSPEALEERYGSLSTMIAHDTEECAAADPAEGQREVVECAVPAGTLRLTTFDSAPAVRAARRERVDLRAGTLSGTAGAAGYYHFDPENSGNQEPAVIYWDSAAGPQSAELTGAQGATLDTLTSHFASTDPRVAAPTSPANPQLREFADKFMDISDCARQSTFITGETEENLCQPKDQITAVVGRFQRRRDLLGVRRTQLRAWREASDRTGEDYWFEDDRSEKQGSFYAYVDADGTPTIYWDWNEQGCNCYAIGYAFDGTLDELRTWWEG